MLPNLKPGFFSNLRNDLPASVVVFLVAVPLCLGIALASGAPLFSGIIAGMVGGILVSLISKSPLGVSGPAAGLAVIVLHGIEDIGGFEIFLLAVVFAGLLQIAAGVLKAGIIGYYFPSAVIKGMLSGIGVIIFLKQIPHAFGYDRDPEGDLTFAQQDGYNTFSELPHMLDYVSPGAIIISVISLAVLILWEAPFMKRQRIFGLIQGPLVVVVSGILLQNYFESFPDLILGAEHLVSLPVASSLEGFKNLFTTPDFTAWQNPMVYSLGAIMALVASLETLLCVEATDKLDPYKRITPTNRELIAQGVGNMVSGLIGGLPVTQVIVRSSANIQSGGRTRASAFFHGILVLISVIAIPELLNMIPKASLAAILLVVGYKLAKPSIFKSVYKLGWSQFLPYIITVLGIAFTDLLMGIGLGLAVAIGYILYNNFKVPYHFSMSDYEPGKPIRLNMSEDVSFLNKAAIMESLRKLPDNTSVIIDTTLNRSMHPDVREIIDDFKEGAEARGIIVTEETRTAEGHNSVRHLNDIIPSIEAEVKEDSATDKTT